MTRSLLLLSVCLGLLVSSAALPAGQPDQQVQAELYRQLHRYLVPKLATLTEEQKLLFARKLWNRIHSRRVGTIKIESSRGPWINDQDSLARMLWNFLLYQLYVIRHIRTFINAFDSLLIIANYDFLYIFVNNCLLLIEIQRHQEFLSDSRHFWEPLESLLIVLRTWNLLNLPTISIPTILFRGITLDLMLRSDKAIKP